MSSEILTSVDGGVLTVTLNRPEKFNALTFTMYDAIADICTNVPADGSVKAIVFRGAGGKAFAAGTDISLGEGWYLNADVKKVWLNTDVTWNNTALGTVKVARSI